ncbi:hypothetical protein CONCODRAFT_7328 [Conidiobolus coronatus NRRL 28638]|uniref:Reverse transcriptase domain-containing protein n=1 Tax=Conidiobolus coronatus (strain ATCC 28846 / CBS 209.66 / NRRL 28638) TaxID=796925 RepID=A0A137P586_CONC2|nr:hypothetical protein CONCODRAFT_7328 [Conidiobolus coronatus NRRL 28638]|eukprot:KXN70094.1 hypothetical protein CONCODRAFT_7328 [Conidiobolus coronatus NRRL 28638]
MSASISLYSLTLSCDYLTLPRNPLTVATLNVRGLASDDKWYTLLNLLDHIPSHIDIVALQNTGVPEIPTPDLLLGDMNLVVDKTFDRSPPAQFPSTGSIEYTTWTNILDLKDCALIYNRNTATRLVRILAKQKLFHRFTDIHTWPIRISDHRAIPPSMMEDASFISRALPYAQSYADGTHKLHNFKTLLTQTALEVGRVRRREKTRRTRAAANELYHLAANAPTNMVSLKDHGLNTGWAIFLDQEKAYDRVSWDYLSLLLNTIGFPPPILAWFNAQNFLPSGKSFKTPTTKPILLHILSHSTLMTPPSNCHPLSGEEHLPSMHHRLTRHLGSPYLPQHLHLHDAHLIQMLFPLG